jgi:hypothetical protein
LYKKFVPNRAPHLRNVSHAPAFRETISLTELWQAEGRRDRVIDLLASTRSRFTEGFATADLVRSTVVLENLRASA